MATSSDDGEKKVYIWQHTVSQEIDTDLLRVPPHFTGMVLGRKVCVPINAFSYNWSFLGLFLPVKWGCTPQDGTM